MKQAEEKMNDTILVQIAAEGVFMKHPKVIFSL